MKNKRFSEEIRDLADARRVIDEWRYHYNHERPHSSLGKIPPTVSEKQAA